MKIHICSTGIWVVSSIFLCILAYRQEWYLFFGGVLLDFLFFYHQKYVDRMYAKELEKITDALDQMLLKKEITMGYENADTLSAKILTQIHRINAANNGYQNFLQQEKEGIKKLLAEISHQLRTPLANMESYLALLDDEIRVKSQKEYLEAVKCSEEKIKFLTERFILAARMENNIIQIHKIPSDLKETVARAVFQVYKNAERKEIFIEVTDERIDKCMLGHDVNWLSEAVYNLLDNSVKYSPKNSCINIFLRANEMFSEICVEDEGIGIEKDEENKIFQIYYRGKNISGEEGYGMGLFITREIIKKHDGFLKAKRRKQGLSISIFLPKTGTS